MFFKKPQPDKTGIDEAIEQVLSEMRGFDAHDDEYSKMVDQLVKLNEIKACGRPTPISKETLAVIAGNLVGIVLILGYEQGHVITSKALGVLIKAR